MRSLREVFPEKKIFLPVIHVESRSQALENVRIAVGEGADGVFLINHDVSGLELTEVYHEVRARYPELWTGLNYLHTTPRVALMQAVRLSAAGLWVDNGGIRENTKHPAREARLLHKIREGFVGGRDTLLFGGVAFKYQPVVTDVARAAKLAVPYIDVITTSGSGTGRAADPEKVRLMRRAVGDHPIAIASGITPENISQYLEFADCFLVATGVSFSHTKLDPARIRALVQALSI